MVKLSRCTQGLRLQLFRKRRSCVALFDAYEQRYTTTCNSASAKEEASSLRSGTSGWLWPLHWLHIFIQTHTRSLGPASQRVRNFPIRPWLAEQVHAVLSCVKAVTAASMTLDPSTKPCQECIYSTQTNLFRQHQASHCPGAALASAAPLNDSSKGPRRFVPAGASAPRPWGACSRNAYSTHPHPAYSPLVEPESVHPPWRRR